MMAGGSYGLVGVIDNSGMDNKPGTVTVAGKPSIDVPPGTLGSIWKQAGLKKD
jgi:hypothetical protein